MNTRNKTVSRLFASTLAITLVLALIPATPAFAGAPMCTPGDTVELGLGIDGSSSIESDDFDLQQDAYISVLAGLPIDGSVSVGVKQFASGVATVHPTTNIASQGDLDALIAAVTAMTQAGGQTQIAGTIDAFTTELLTNAIVSDRQIIDISTDGVQTQAGDPVTSSAAAIAAGIEQVNALGIGVMPTFNDGVGSFSIEVIDFMDFEDALEGKIMTELCQEGIGGEILSINASALLVSGFMMNAMWILPTIAATGIAGTAFYLIRSRLNKTSEE